MNHDEAEQIRAARAARRDAEMASRYAEAAPAQPPAGVGAAQPPPEVPAGADVAEVLAGLVEEMRALARSERTTTPVEVDAVYGCIALVEAAQAATGARATGGENRHEAIEEAARAAYSAGYSADGTTPAPDGQWDLPGLVNSRKRYRRIARVAVEAYLAKLAPPAPVAPGVAELLAECERRLSDPHGMGHGGACITCDEIVRYLAPGGSDEEGEGTVYVDNVRIKASVGRYTDRSWCHLLTDDPTMTELHALAQRIGLRREWFQPPKALRPGWAAPWWRGHYDVTEAKRKEAVLAGAVEIHFADWSEKIAGFKAALTSIRADGTGS